MCYRTGHTVWIDMAIQYLYSMPAFISKSTTAIYFDDSTSGALKSTSKSTLPNSEMTGPGLTFTTVKKYLNKGRYFHNAYRTSILSCKKVFIVDMQTLYIYIYIVCKTPETWSVKRRRTILIGQNDVVSIQSTSAITVGYIYIYIYMHIYRRTESCIKKTGMFRFYLVRVVAIRNLDDLPYTQHGISGHSRFEQNLRNASSSSHIMLVEASSIL
jgi:hypothetical protein